MVTPDQLATLRYLIYRSETLDELTKRIVTFLLNGSQGLTRPVCVCLARGASGYSRNEINAAAGSLREANSRKIEIRLNQQLRLMGTEMRLSCQYGNPEGEKGFDEQGGPHRYTFFLGKRGYGACSNGTELKATKKELDQVDILAGMLFEDEVRRTEKSRAS
jgi:hypothetical protein